MEPKFILIYERLDNLNGKLNNGYVYVTEYVRFFEKDDIQEYLNDCFKNYIDFKIICIYEIKQQVQYKRTIIETFKYTIL